jgi:hypothetical protein
MKDHQTSKRSQSNAAIYVWQSDYLLLWPKFGFFGDVPTEDYNLDVHIVLYFNRKEKTTSHWYLVDNYSPMRQKMGYWEGEAKIVNHIWMTFLLFYNKHLIFCVDCRKFWTVHTTVYSIHYTVAIGLSKLIAIHFSGFFIIFILIVNENWELTSYY